MSLERVRNVCFAATMAWVPVLLVVTILGAINNARPPWEALYIGVGAVGLAASTTFTVTAIMLAMRHTRQEAASGRVRRSRRPPQGINLLGLVALAGNVVAVGLTGHVNVLNVVLALLIGALLLLLREHARREGIRDRSH